MSIVYREGFVDEADPVSRHPDFFHPDDVHLRKPAEMFALKWNVNIPDLCYESNDTILLVLADIISVDNHFMNKLKLHIPRVHTFLMKLKDVEKVMN